MEFAGKLERGKVIELQIHGLGAEVEKTDRVATVFELFFVNTDVAVRAHARRFFAERILVDCQHFVVAQEREREVVELVHVAPDEQRRGEEAPEADVGVLFIRRQARGMQVAPADLADDEHVRVVPVAGPGKGRGLVLLETNAAQAAPGVGDVPGGAPAIAVHLAAPFPDVAHAILAKAENNVAFLLAQALAHERVGRDKLRLPGARRLETAPVGGGYGIIRRITPLLFHFGPVAAPVVFQIIETPVRVSLRVLHFMVEARRTSAARPRAGRGIKPGL